MTRRRSRSIAWVSLLATLFSAVSPAIAAALLIDRPAALAQMLGIPAAEASAHHDHAAPASDDDGGTPKSPEDGSPHTNHGIYCSLCLNASSTLAVAGAPSPALLATAASERVFPALQHSFTPAFHPFFRSRAPPR